MQVTSAVQPATAGADYDDEDDEDSYDEEVSHGYEWTEQDSWDALTDGMCGKMPSNPLEYDAMMDAMGY